MKSWRDKYLAMISDNIMCAALNAMQARSKHRAIGLAEFTTYIELCENKLPEEYYAVPPVDDGVEESGHRVRVRWTSPVTSGFPENDRFFMEVFPCEAGWKAPTVIILHALMSANATGYHQLARRFNQLGWNAVFPHLPFHYERTPHGYLNGELAVSPELRRTGEGLRQAVVEMRQVIQWCRERGCSEFALWATSYGAWIGALLSFLEPDFRFINLMTPIVDMHHVIWKSAAASSLRRQLGLRGITPELVARHYHLTSPFHRKPLTPPDRIYLVGGIYDKLSDLRDLERLREFWGPVHFLKVSQGHFGYRAARESFDRIHADGLLTLPDSVRV